MSDFESTNKGFRITFDNGWTVSVQFGSGNYCQNRHLTPQYLPVVPVPASPDAEIAAFKGDEWYNFGTDKVKGWVKPNEVLEFMNKIAKLKE